MRTLSVEIFGRRVLVYESIQRLIKEGKYAYEKDALRYILKVTDDCGYSKEKDFTHVYEQYKKFKKQIKR